MKEKSKCSVFCEMERMGQSPCQLECLIEREQKNKNKMSTETQKKETINEFIERISKSNGSENHEEIKQAMLDCVDFLEDTFFTKEDVLNNINNALKMKSSDLDLYTDENNDITEKWFDKPKVEIQEPSEKEEYNVYLFVGYSGIENKMRVLGSSGLRFKNLPTMQEIIDAINEAYLLNDVIILSISYLTKEQYLSLSSDVKSE